MDIAILGPGAIGSTFAYYLGKAGHTVTVVARGSRLAQLERDRAIVLVSGAQQPVEVAAALDERVAYDLVLVTVLAPQVDAVLPTLRRSAAKQVMFMFNTFEPLDKLRDAVGKERFLFGFPGGVFTILRDGKADAQVRGGTVVGDEAWTKTFSQAGIPSSYEADMHVWLRTHAALVAPLMALGTVVAARPGGVTWGEARRYATAMQRGFALVRELGHTLRPAFFGLLAKSPRFVVTALLWAMSRTKMLRDLGVLGPAEPRMLVDMMTAAAPGKTDALLAIRP